MAALVVTAVLAWFHGEHGRQKATMAEKWLLSVVFVLWVVALSLYVTSSV